MIISGSKRFIESNFNNEEEIEQIVFENYEYLFGPSSFILPKTLIKTLDGTGTIPDGFAIDLSNRKWYLIEAELIKHSVWSHIAPQISKQIIASQQQISRNLLIEMSVNQYTTNNSIKEKFSDENIPEIDIRRVLSEILETEPIVGIPIDKISEDLKEWAKTLKSNVKLWVIKKFIELENPDNIIYEFPEEYKPDIDTESNESGDKSNEIKTYDVTIFNLIENDLLHPGDLLYMSYKPGKGNKKDYTATIQEDGSLLVMNQQFSSPSYAALYCINDAGSPRKTVNGWTSCKTDNDCTLSQVREKYIKNK